MKRNNKNQNNFRVMALWLEEQDAKEVAKICPSTVVDVREGDEIFHERADVIWDLS